VKNLPYGDFEVMNRRTQTSFTQRVKRVRQLLLFIC